MRISWQQEGKNETKHLRKAGGSLRRIRLLWVDDQIGELEPLLNLLEASGVSVKTAVNAEDGWRVVSEWHPHIALVDEHMPGEEGTALIARIKREYPFVCTVLVTYDGESELVGRAMRAGADMYLLKPVRLPELEAVIQRVAVGGLSLRESAVLLVAKSGHLEQWEEWFDLYGQVVSASLPEHVYERLQENFARFVRDNYEEVVEGGVPASHTVLRQVFEQYVEGGAVVVVMDGMRLDQWKAIQGFVSRELEPVYEGMFVALVPTVTWWCRKALLSGAIPTASSLDKPESVVVGELFEGKEVLYMPVGLDTLRAQLVEMESVVRRGGVVVVVVSLLDELTHELTHMRRVAEVLARAQTMAEVSARWFCGSALWKEVLGLARRVSSMRVIFVSDHGWVRVTEPVVIVSEGGKGNYRWHTAERITPLVKRGWVEFGRGRLRLPSAVSGERVVVAWGTHFLVFEGRKREAIRDYAGTLQHGGISLEEMLVPVAVYQG